MMDECVGHMTEKVVIPPADEIEVYPRRHTTRAAAEYKPYEPMAGPWCRRWRTRAKATVSTSPD